MRLFSRFQNGFQWLLPLLVLLSACEQEVEVDMPSPAPRLVINSLFTPDSLFTVRVYSSLPVLDTQRYVVPDNATVTLYEEDQEVEMLPYDPARKYYRSLSFKPVAGKSYRVRVTAPGFPEASARSNVPVPVPIGEFIFKDTAGVYGEGFYHGGATFTLDDPTARDDYYAVQATFNYMYVRPVFPATWGDSTRYDTIRGIGTLPLFSEQPTIQITEWGGHMALVNDGVFDGQRYSIAVNFYSLANYRHGPNGNQPMRLVWALKSVSEAYYEYFRKLDGHVNNQSFSLFGGEPVGMYTNVENGYGVFAGYSQDTVSVVR
jgi:hypothetical protein